LELLSQEPPWLELLFLLALVSELVLQISLVLVSLLP
jgi:hypothetical protein